MPCELRTTGSASVPWNSDIVARTTWDEKSGGRVTAILARYFADE